MFDAPAESISVFDKNSGGGIIKAQNFKLNKEIKQSFNDDMVFTSFKYEILRDQNNSISQSINSSVHVKTEIEIETNYDLSNKVEKYKVGMRNEVREKVHKENVLKIKICPFLTKDGHHQTWRLHMIKVHFTCCICEHKSDNEIQGEIHFAKQHQEDKGYLKCNIGGCLFKANVNRHLKHKEIKQYTLGSTVNSHIKTVHRGICPKKCSEKE